MVHAPREAARLYGLRSAGLRIGCTYGRWRQRPQSIGVAGLCAKHHFDGASHSVDHAAKLDEASVASALNDTAMMSADRGVD
jgi:hypothetical protein